MTRYADPQELVDQVGSGDAAAIVRALVDVRRALAEIRAAIRELDGTPLLEEVSDVGRDEPPSPPAESEIERARRGPSVHDAERGRAALSAELQREESRELLEGMSQREKIRTAQRLQNILAHLDRMEGEDLHALPPDIYDLYHGTALDPLRDRVRSLQDEIHRDLMGPGIERGES